jgi:hypothetical protein
MNSSSAVEYAAAPVPHAHEGTGAQRGPGQLCQVSQEGPRHKSKPGRPPEFLCGGKIVMFFPGKERVDFWDYLIRFPWLNGSGYRATQRSPNNPALTGNSSAALQCRDPRGGRCSRHRRRKLLAQ